MTNQEILTKAIEKAKQNGMKFRDGMAPIGEYRTYLGAPLAPAIIFNHGFAKALWGEEETVFGNGVDWQYHLQQMVIAENPIEYLGAHLDGN